MKKSANTLILLASLLIFGIISITGCASSFPIVRMYNGSQLEKQQISVISPTGGYEGLAGGRQDVYILKVDDTQFKKADIDNHASIEVLPGEHHLTVAAMIMHNGKRYPFEDPEPLTYKFEGGKQYYVYCTATDSEQSIIHFWMEDSSGKVVAGTK